MSRRAWLRSILAVVVCLALTGCGSASGSGAGAKAARPATAATSSGAGVPGSPSSGAASGGSSAQAGHPTNVTAAWVAVVANQVIPMMALDGGYFRQQGLNVDLRYIPGSATGMAALLSNQIQFLGAAGSAVVSAAAGGAPVRMVAGFVDVPVFVAMTVPSITRPSQLRGTTWAIDHIGTTVYFDLLAMLQHFGLKASDVKLITANNPSGELAAVISGRAQGLLVAPPATLLAQQKAGLRPFFNLAKLGVSEQNVGVAVTETYAQAHPQVVESYLKASIEGIHRFKTDRAFAYQIFRKYLKYTNPKLLQTAYDAYAPLFATTPAPSVAGMQRVIQEVSVQDSKAKRLTPAQTIDSSFMDAIVRSGFIRKVYGTNAASSAG